MKKVLFVCTSGYRAEILANIFNEDSMMVTKACGTNSIDQSLIDWADIIICIDKYHEECINEMFKHDKKIICLDLENENYESKEFQDEIKRKIERLIKDA